MLKTEIKKYLIALLPVISAAILFLIIRKIVLGNTSTNLNELMNNPFLEATVSQKYATITYTLDLYIKLLFVPHPLTYDYYPYHIQLVGWQNIWVILSLLFYISILILACYGFRRKRIHSYGILFYLITLSIVSELYSVPR